MYKKPIFPKTTISRNESTEGESIEIKIERMVNNKENIEQGAELIYTDSREGTVSGYNIRTDRFDVAIEAMDKVAGAKIAKREARFKQQEEAKIIDMKGDKGGDNTPSTGGTNE